VLLPLSNQNVYLASIGKNPLQPIVPPVVDDNAAQMAAIDLNQAPANNVNTTPSQSDGINQLASGFADDNTSSAANVAVVNNNTTNTTVIAATTTIAIGNNDNNKPSNTSTVKEPQVQINDLLNDNGPNAVKVANTEGSTAGDGNSVSFINYTVVAGDTLYSIARKFSIPVDNIKADNQLTDNTVKLNQILRIRSNQPQMKS
jgi:LysM repeat protein